jgi:hypothetical protein
MGYDWTMSGYVICIEKKNFSKLREAITPLFEEGDQYFSGLGNVKGPEVSDESFLRELFREFGWHVGFCPKNGHLVELEQESYKLGNEEVLLNVVAPYCTEGDHIDGRGEDGCLWRWVLSPTDGCYELPGLVFYPTGECPFKQHVELCSACSFSLICNTSGVVLRTAKCDHCGGELVLKDLDGEAEPVAGTTCTCLKRKFEMPA